MGAECRVIIVASFWHCICSRNIGGALGMVVGLAGLCGFGAKSKLVVLCSRVLTGSDPAATKPYLVPLSTLIALPALELHLECVFALHL